ncbi:nitrogen fixation protein NifQ [Azospirillum fermentarium]|uniref:nitrogen fixation protein NifQ n=1 Tax=Azospirillum fermentarium TaxID=1233114 RepID=UPI002225D884|nr:nitrogen fixation protein NifQ [Azospirillum fermentarium]MCW2245738.1 nitrogen fixation protein NifQ [Azospirillum fermentarium]
MIVRKLDTRQTEPTAGSPVTNDSHPPPAVEGVSDAYLFTRILALAADEPRPLTHATGLTRAVLERLADRYVPAMGARVAALPHGDDTGEDTYEEPDLRAMILEHRAGRTEEEEWLAAIVARRCNAANHLWQDMGFAGRSDLGTLFRRHFPALVAANSGDMKWKKFFYRQLCQREGFLLCKSPNCECCDDHDACFGGETGNPLKD